MLVWRCAFSLQSFLCSHFFSQKFSKLHELAFYLFFYRCDKGLPNRRRLLSIGFVWFCEKLKSINSLFSVKRSFALSGSADRTRWHSVNPIQIMLPMLTFCSSFEGMVFDKWFGLTQTIVFQKF